jgi:predicted porin
MIKARAAVAAVGMFAGIASAQSSVTLYGQVDLNYQ